MKETIKIIAVGVVVMMTLPAAYRVWLIFHPQPPADCTSISRSLERSAEERAVRLLKTPVREWTESDKSAEPKMFAWQKTHEKTILPWDWTEEARRKDPERFVRLWSDLFAECGSELRDQARRLEKDIASRNRRIRTEETVYAHDTNRLAFVGHCLKTNSFPATVRIQRLSKGRFWGWNTTAETLTFSNALAACDLSNGRGWLLEERKRLDRLHCDLIERRRELVSCQESLHEVSRRQAIVREVRERLEREGVRDCRNAEVALSRVVGEKACRPNPAKR